MSATPPTAPTGPLPIAEVRANALGVMDELVDSGVKLLTIACNSASAAVLRDARERYTARYGIPVIEVIQPAVRRAVAATRTGRVGVIGTSATVGSRAYEDTFAAAPDLEITSVACPAFVPYVEAGITTGPELLAVAREYLAPLIAARVDTVVLGCTHYPLLTGVLSFVLGEDVTLVSSAEETAKDVYRSLASRGLERTDAAAPEHHFIATGDAAAVRAPCPPLPRTRGPQRPPRGPRRGAVSHRQPGPDHPGDDRRRAGRRGPAADLQLRGRTRRRGNTAVKLTIVGCTGSFPGPGSPASCYLLTANDGERNWKIVLDLGSGALGAIQRYTDLEDIDAIFLTHLHPDHCMDLCGLHVAVRWKPGGWGRGRIPVWGPGRHGRPDGHRVRPGPGSRDA